MEKDLALLHIFMVAISVSQSLKYHLLKPVKDHDQQIKVPKCLGQPKKKKKSLVRQAQPNLVQTPDPYLFYNFYNNI